MTKARVSVVYRNSVFLIPIKALFILCHKICSFFLVSSLLTGSSLREASRCYSSCVFFPVLLRSSERYSLTLVRKGLLHGRLLEGLLLLLMELLLLHLELLLLLQLLLVELLLLLHLHLVVAAAALV